MNIFFKDYENKNLNKLFIKMIFNAQLGSHIDKIKNLDKSYELGTYIWKDFNSNIHNDRNKFNEEETYISFTAMMKMKDDKCSIYNYLFFWFREYADFSDKEYSLEFTNKICEELNKIMHYKNKSLDLKDIDKSFFENLTIEKIVILDKIMSIDKWKELLNKYFEKENKEIIYVANKIMFFFLLQIDFFVIFILIKNKICEKKLTELLNIFF